MEAKFLILLVTIFFNGVTCANGAVVNVDANPTEVTPPSSTISIDHSIIKNNNSSTLISATNSSQPALPLGPTTGNTKETGAVDTKVDDTTNKKPIEPAHAAENKTAVTPPVVPVNGSATLSPPVPAEDNNSTKTLPEPNKANTTTSDGGNSTTPSLPTTVAPATKSNSTVKPVPTTKPSTTNATTTTTTTTTTVATPVPSTTESDSAVEGHKTPKSSEQNERHFDGASFVGGIVLSVGLTAIGFIAFKYYKAGKIDGNYRTL